MAQSVMKIAVATTQASGNGDAANTTHTSDRFESELIALIPHLRAFSHQLCGRQGIAEDMAQEALVKAWRARSRFVAGTNLKAWLFTILRHAFYSHMRRAWREARWDEHLGEQIPAPPDEQVWASELSDFVRGLDALPKHQREALLLTGIAGFSYSDTGKILKTPVGSVKSRAARGRGTLTRYRDGESRLPPRVPKVPSAAYDDILVQLAALTPAGANADRSLPRHEARG